MPTNSTINEADYLNYPSISSRDAQFGRLYKKQLLRVVAMFCALIQYEQDFASLPNVRDFAQLDETFGKTSLLSYLITL